MSMIRTIRKGFTMIELVMVIVILGIVSSIGASIIAQVYESYIVQRAQYRATSKTELALQQIANRLRYAIPGTVGARAGKVATFEPITELTNDSLRVLQWVGYDGDSFEAMTSAADRKSGWSGFCDIAAYVPDSTTLPTPGSNLGTATTIISNLGGSIGDARIFFPQSAGASFGVASGAGENITLDAAIPPGTRIFERYKLAWSSYALEVDANDDLWLYYGFIPDIGFPIGNTRQLLLKNVTNFRFKGTEGAMRLKICKKEQIGMNSSSTIHACKEKVIF